MVAIAGNYAHGVHALMIEWSLLAVLAIDVVKAYSSVLGVR